MENLDSAAARPARTVLIADDDAIFRVTSAGLLRAWGYDCVVVGDGEAALQTLQQANPPTIALLDWQMPYLTGPEICRRIRDSNSPRYIYFILISARDAREDSIAGLRSGADSYITKPFDAEELRAKLDTANRILFMEESLRDLHTETELFLNSVPSILVGTGLTGSITRWNHGARTVFNLNEEDVRGRTLGHCGIPWGADVSIESQIEESIELGAVYESVMVPLRRGDTQRLLMLSIHPLRSHVGAITGSIISGADVTEKLALENQLRQGQKLEAIGQLAAGIAHEINTPIQFVADNVQFLKDSWAAAAVLVNASQALRARVPDSVGAEILRQYDESRREFDPEFSMREIPRALDEAREGLQRVSKIVRAIKEFSHPGSEQKQLTNLNAAIETTVTVARNEWKYVADLETDLDPQLPLTPCITGQFNQVILNIIVNAAHAIGSVVGDGSQGKGRIMIRTRRRDEWVEIVISDTGRGIPPDIRDRIFEPFFTTKEVGKGTGQGLALAHAIITKEHGGRIWFESEIGKGTEFYIRLPLEMDSHGESTSNSALTAQ
jgi:two-component system, NtrC family, sensor kinase